MVISKNKFFLLLGVVFIFPFILHRLIWLAGTEKTTAEMRFLGRTLEVQGTSEHPVFRFIHGKDSIFFNGNIDLGYQPGEIVPVRYRSNDPADARVDSVICLWTDTFFYILPQVLILSILFFTPDRWDPVIPKKALVVFGFKPFLRIVGPSGKESGWLKDGDELPVN